MSSALKHDSFSPAVFFKRASVEAGLLVGASPHPAALWSLDRRFCMFNPLLSELLGYTEQEIGHRPELFTERIHPEDRSAFLSAWQNLRNGEKIAACRYRFVPKHGVEARAVRENSVLFYVADSDVQGVLTLYSEERSEADKIAEPQQLRSVLRGVTHEIGNNLQAISGELELLKWSGTLPADSAAVVSAAIMQIRALTGDMEEYFSVVPAVSDKSGDVASIIEKKLYECQEKTKVNGIQSEFTVNGMLPAVPLDHRFAKAIRTIIDFSYALLAGGGELKIEAGTCRRDEGPYIEVNFVSCCRGTLPIDEERVFRPFINIGAYRPGLSLAVAQRVLRRQAGKILFCKDQTNRGVFSLLIPIPERMA